PAHAPRRRAPEHEQPAHRRLGEDERHHTSRPAHWGSRARSASRIIVDVSLSPGLRGVARRVVTDDATAVALRSGNVPVLGTPAVLALMEEAACAAVDGALPQGATSVGTWVELQHTAPSKDGAQVVAHAE